MVFHHSTNPKIPCLKTAPRPSSRGGILPLPVITLLVLLLLNVYRCFVCLHICPLCVCNACGGQKKPSHPLEWGLKSCELTCRCWEPDLGPLQEQQVCLTPESLCLHLHASLLIFHSFWSYGALPSSSPKPKDQHGHCARNDTDDICQPHLATISRVSYFHLRFWSGLQTGFGDVTSV